MKNIDLFPILVQTLIGLGEVSYTNSYIDIINQSSSGFDNDRAFSFPKFAFQEIASSEVSKYLLALISRKTGGLNQMPAFIFFKS